MRDKKNSWEKGLHRRENKTHCYKGRETWYKKDGIIYIKCENDGG